MSFILFYQTYPCAVTRRVLGALATSQVRRQIYFINCDQLVTRPSAAGGPPDRLARLFSGDLLFVPPTVQAFPSLIALNSECLLVERDDILRLFQPILEQEAMQANPHMVPQSMVGTGAAAAPAFAHSHHDGLPPAPTIGLDTSAMMPLTSGKWRTPATGKSDTMLHLERMQAERQRTDEAFQAKFRPLNNMPPMMDGHAAQPVPISVGGARAEAPPPPAPAASVVAGGGGSGSGGGDSMDRFLGGE